MNKFFRTKHAPSIRSSDRAIDDDFGLLNSHPFIEEIFNALPYIITVLNENRQVVFTNSKVLEYFKIDDLKHLLGKRTGEMIHCIHSSDMPAGCGTSENCKVCGAVNTIMESISTGKKVTNECRITVSEERGHAALDFEVTATPFGFQNRKFTIFSMVDISSEKRRKVLEKIFFHDILNTAANINGFIQLMHEKNPDADPDGLIHIVKGLSRDIIDEINTQKELLLAESGELVPHYSLLEVSAFLEDLKKEYSFFQNKKCDISIHFPFKELELNTDRVLLARILKNMVKNACEASENKDRILLSVMNKGDCIRFSVHNSSYMPMDTQLQIFQRSFSTKGTDRGIGTYSMKLLGETWLKGKVGFYSTKGEGTVFYFDHPIQIIPPSHS